MDLLDYLRHASETAKFAKFCEVSQIQTSHVRLRIPLIKGRERSDSETRGQGIAVR